MLAANGVNTRRIQLIGTGLWDDPRIFADAGVQGGWFAAPDPAGYRAFSGRYRQRYGQDPLRPATLAYDAVSLVAALVKTQGPARFSEEVLTNQSGFAGIDGVFRFRPDGTNQRGLAVMRVTTSGPQVISPAPKAFSAGLRHLRRQIRHHGIEHRKARAGDAQAAVDRLDQALVRRATAMRAGSSGWPAKRRVALGVDAFGEPQTHQQIFVGLLGARQRLVGDDAMAAGLDTHQPGLGAPLGRGRVTRAVDRRAARARRARRRHIRDSASRRDCAGIRRRPARDWKFRKPAGRARR